MTLDNTWNFYDHLTKKYSHMHLFRIISWIIYTLLRSSTRWTTFFIMSFFGSTKFTWKNRSLNIRISNLLSMQKASQNHQQKKGFEYMKSQSNGNCFAKSVFQISVCAIKISCPIFFLRFGSCWPLSLHKTLFDLASLSELYHKPLTKFVSARSFTLSEFVDTLKATNANNAAQCTILKRLETWIASWEWVTA